MVIMFKCTQAMRIFAAFRLPRLPILLFCLDLHVLLDGAHAFGLFSQDSKPADDRATSHLGAQFELIWWQFSVAETTKAKPNFRRSEGKTLIVKDE